MKKILPVIIVLLIAISVGGFFIFKNKTSGNYSSITSSKDVSKQINLAEVSRHASASDCWMAIDGKIYDVTSFIPNHPGGDAILQGCGKDATSMFNSRPNDGTSHSSRARNILSQYQIGVLAN